jgi:hypothetical protein
MSRRGGKEAWPKPGAATGFRRWRRVWRTEPGCRDGGRTGWRSDAPCADPARPSFRRHLTRNAAAKVAGLRPETQGGQPPAPICEPATGAARSLRFPDNPGAALTCATLCPRQSPVSGCKSGGDRRGTLRFPGRRIRAEINARPFEGGQVFFRWRVLWYVRPPEPRVQPPIMVLLGGGKAARAALSHGWAARRPPT